MWKTIAQLWVSIGLIIETVNSGTRTINNLVTTAEAHSVNFKAISMAELQAKQVSAEVKSAQKIEALKVAAA